MLSNLDLNWWRSQVDNKKAMNHGEVLIREGRKALLDVCLAAPGRSSGRFAILIAYQQQLKTTGWLAQAQRSQDALVSPVTEKVFPCGDSSH
jgi:hypothetical protein